MKQILPLLCLLALPAGATAQGDVLFANFGHLPHTLFTTNHLGNSGLMSGTDAFRIGLYIAPDGTTTESLFTLVAVATNNPLVPGRFNGGIVDVHSPGQSIQYQIKAWSLFAGPTYEDAVASGIGIAGKSPIARVFPGFSAAPPANLFGLEPGQLTSGIELVPTIPEPSTYALAALGALLMFCCRRRR